MLLGGQHPAIGGTQGYRILLGVGTNRPS